MHEIEDEDFHREYKMEQLIQSIRRQEHHEVYFARHLKTGNQVCVKKIHSKILKKRSKLMQSLQTSEVKMLAEVEHPKIVKVLETLSRIHKNAKYPFVMKLEMAPKLF